MKKEKYIFIVLAVFILQACHTSKKIVEKQAVDTISVPKMATTDDIVKRLQNTQPKFTTANASKMSIDINLKEREYNVAASCQIVADSAIYLSIMPAFGMEFFKLELSPAKFILIDKLNKRYFEGTYDYLKNQFGVAINFSNIQSLISNQLFIVEKDNYSPSDFSWKNNDPKSSALVSKNIKTEQETTVSAEILNRISDIIIKASEYNSLVSVNYSDFQQTDNFLFPLQVKLGAEQNGIKKASFEFDIQKIKFNEPLVLKPANLSKYVRGDINSLLKK